MMSDDSASRQRREQELARNGFPHFSDAQLAEKVAQFVREHNAAQDDYDPLVGRMVAELDRRINRRREKP